MRYLWGPTGIVARQSSGGTVAWYLADQLGTVRNIINNSGAIIDHVDFSAFGTVLNESSPTNGDRFTGFAMLERDTVTGLNLAVYRGENSGTGRWVSEDPVGINGGDDNFYRYVLNEPTYGEDPLGLQQAGQYGGTDGRTKGPAKHRGGDRPGLHPFLPRAGRGQDTGGGFNGGGGQGKEPFPSPWGWRAQPSGRGPISSIAPLGKNQTTVLVCDPITGKITAEPGYFIPWGPTVYIIRPSSGPQHFPSLRDPFGRGPVKTFPPGPEVASGISRIQKRNPSESCGERA